jgi:hypothetical protein
MSHDAKSGSKTLTRTINHPCDPAKYPFDLLYQTCQYRRKIAMLSEAVEKSHRKINRRSFNLKNCGKKCRSEELQRERLQY